jgi:hypothetical protein
MHFRTEAAAGKGDANVLFVVEMCIRTVFAPWFPATRAGSPPLFSMDVSLLRKTFL